MTLHQHYVDSKFALPVFGRPLYVAGVTDEPGAVEQAWVLAWLGFISSLIALFVLHLPCESAYLESVKMNSCDVIWGILSFLRHKRTIVA